MRNKVVILIICLMLATSLIGCSNNNDGNNGTDQETRADEKIEIGLAHVEPEIRSVHIGCEEFKKYVEEETDGRVEVNIYPNAQLGGDRQSIEAVSLGTLEMTVAAAAQLATYDDVFMVLDLPFIFEDREASYRAVDGALGEKLNSVLPSVGIYGLGYNDNGLRQTTNNVRPITEPSDFQGIKIRVMENPIYIEMFKLLGANPTPINFGELYTALQQGTVDAQENAASLVYTSNFHEVQDYMSLTGHVYSYNIIAINDEFYNGLPEDIRSIVKEGAEKYLRDYQREMESSEDSMYIEKLEEAGMKVNDISPENRQKFMDAIKPLYEEYESIIGADVIELARQANQ